MYLFVSPEFIMHTEFTVMAESCVNVLKDCSNSCITRLHIRHRTPFKRNCLSEIYIVESYACPSDFHPSSLSRNPVVGVHFIELAFLLTPTHLILFSTSAPDDYDSRDSSPTVAFKYIQSDENQLYNNLYTYIVYFTLNQKNILLTAFICVEMLLLF